MEENIYPEICRLSRGVEVSQQWELGTRVLLHLDHDSEYVFVFDPRLWLVSRISRRVDTFQLITREPCGLIYGNDFAKRIRSYEQAVAYAKSIFVLRPESSEATLYEAPRLLVL